MQCKLIRSTYVFLTICAGHYVRHLWSLDLLFAIKAAHIYLACPTTHTSLVTTHPSTANTPNGRHTSWQRWLPPWSSSQRPCLRWPRRGSRPSPTILALSRTFVSQTRTRLVRTCIYFVHISLLSCVHACNIYIRRRLQFASTGSLARTRWRSPRTTSSTRR